MSEETPAMTRYDAFSGWSTPTPARDVIRTTCHNASYQGFREPATMLEPQGARGGSSTASVDPDSAELVEREQRHQTRRDRAADALYIGKDT